MPLTWCMVWKVLILHPSPLTPSLYHHSPCSLHTHSPSLLTLHHLTLTFIPLTAHSAPPHPHTLHCSLCIPLSPSPLTHHSSLSSLLTLHPLTPHFFTFLTAHSAPLILTPSLPHSHSSLLTSYLSLLSLHSLILTPQPLTHPLTLHSSHPHRL